MHHFWVHVYCGLDNGVTILTQHSPVTEGQKNVPGCDNHITTI